MKSASVGELPPGLQNLWRLQHLPCSEAVRLCSHIRVNGLHYRVGDYVSSQQQYGVVKVLIMAGDDSRCFAYVQLFDLAEQLQPPLNHLRALRPRDASALFPLSLCNCCEVFCPSADVFWLVNEFETVVNA